MQRTLHTVYGSAVVQVNAPRKTTGPESGTFKDRCGRGPLLEKGRIPAFNLIQYYERKAKMVIIVHSSHPFTEEYAAKSAEANETLPPLPENVVAHGPYSFPVPGVGAGGINIYEVDDSNFTECMDAVVGIFNQLLFKMPGYTYELQIAYENSDWQRMANSNSRSSRYKFICHHIWINT